jgi:FkbM family methyltransferase
MTETRSDLIYDIGLFDGSDTAYYLFRGYNVVAVDANPLMIEKAKLRFAREIEAKRLKLLNVGIAERPGTATFWISDVPGWSSFDRTLASRDGTAHRPVSVSGVPFSQLLAENGIPHYLKIDIVGNDKLCVNALRGNKIPRFISVGVDRVRDSTVVSEEQATAMLDLLRDVGYTRFKLVVQGLGYRSVRRNRFTSLCLRLVTSAARGRLRVRGVSKIVERFTDSARIAPLGFPFSPSCSGPWGDDIPGGWLTFEEASSVCFRERRPFIRPHHGFWRDWHATY